MLNQAQINKCLKTKEGTVWFSGLRLETTPFSSLWALLCRFQTLPPEVDWCHPVASLSTALPGGSTRRLSATSYVSCTIMTLVSKPLPSLTTCLELHTHYLFSFSQQTQDIEASASICQMGTQRLKVGLRICLITKLAST